MVVTRPGRWGNPFATADEFEAALEWCLHLRCDNIVDFKMMHMQNIADHLHELRGKNLACWCGPDESCHADVLIREANR